MAACRGASLPTKARSVIGYTLFAFASVSPDGFRQGMRGAQRVKSQGRRVKGRGIEACSLDTAAPSGGQAFADRLRFSSLCS